MIIVQDITQVAGHAGDLTLTVSTASLVRNLIIIGQLPNCRVKEELVASFGGLDGFDDSFLKLTPKGVRAERGLVASDVWSLSVTEKIALLKGMASVLKGRLTDRYCICDMGPAVLLPVAAFASLLREDIASAQKAWGAFSKIHRLCAERLTDVDSQRGLAGMSFAAFVSSQAGTSLLLELEESLESKGKRAAAQMLATYRLVDHGSNGLSNN